MPFNQKVANPVDLHLPFDAEAPRDAPRIGQCQTNCIDAMTKWINEYGKKNKLHSFRETPWNLQDFAVALQRGIWQSLDILDILYPCIVVSSSGAFVSILTLTLHLDLAIHFRKMHHKHQAARLRSLPSPCCPPIDFFVFNFHSLWLALPSTFRFWLFKCVLKYKSILHINIVQYNGWQCTVCVNTIIWGFP